VPWKPSDAGRFNRKLRKGSAKRKRQFAHVANSVLKRTGDEGRAIAAANAVAKRSRKKRGKSGRRNARS
jgi:hypothetical protein